VTLPKPGPFLAVATLTAVLLTPVCGLLHRCGCTVLWSGGEAGCNVRQAQGPHCPWCEHRVLGAVAAVLIFAGQLLGFRVAKRRTSPAAAALVATLTLAPASVLAGALVWLPTDYPHFLGRDARERVGLPEGPISCRGRGTTAALCCPRR